MSDETIPQKRCSTCSEMKPLEMFSRNKSKADGYQDRCKACFAKYRKDNAEKLKEKKQAYCKANAEKVKARQQAHRKANIEAIRKREKNYYAENRETILAKNE